MAAEIGREILPNLGLDQMRLFWEHFVPLQKPFVRSLGAAANKTGRSLANIVELRASKYRYMVLVELPRVQFCESKFHFSLKVYSIIDYYPD
jgi:hypothetical protein